jgi:hypothetical protein
VTTLEAAQQEAACARHGAAYTPVDPSQMCAVSDGVYEGEPAQGVRYAAPPHMTGWYITTARYNGDHKTLKVEHAAHVIGRRPDIAVFLALPPGYRFEAGPDSAGAWYDEAVTQEDASG